MEALTALSLAGNVVQFAELGIKVTKTAIHYYKSADGALKDLVTDKKEAEDLVKVFREVSKVPLALKDPDLIELVDKCTQLSDELIGLIEGLQIDPTKLKVFQAAKKSVKALRSRTEIKELRSRMIAVRDTISSRIILLLSQEQDKLLSSFERLEDLSKNTFESTQRQLDRLSAQSRSLHGAASSLETKILEMSRKQDEENKVLRSMAESLKTFLHDTQDSTKLLNILQSLHFSQLQERHSEILTAHNKTFEWIFDPRSPVNLGSWLKSDNDIYWIEGKPGSGKSTLMKFFLHDPRTRALLEGWAGNDRLIIANHFFWNAGSPLQKSQLGLLRTLLFQILVTCPNIIPKVCPDQWAARITEMIHVWDRDSLFEVFERISKLPGLPIKVCLFVDGLDEYDGDHQELVNLLLSIVKSKCFKLCVASRPHAEFVDAFGEISWKLRLQDLTYNDIRLYIKDILEENERFQGLRAQNQDAADTFVNEIQMKAQGVFLWVYLVIRSLLKGLRNIDTIADLRARLDELPGELETYFVHMFNSIDRVYQMTTAQIFKLIVTSPSPLAITAFYFLDQELEFGPRFAFGNRIKEITEDEFETILKEESRQLQAHCGDLVQVNKHTGYGPHPRYTVGFLHQTVSAFLATTEMDELLSAKAGKTFNPNQTLSRVLLAGLKATERKHMVERGAPLFRDMFMYVCRSGIQANKIEEEILDDAEAFLESQESVGSILVQSTDSDCETVVGLALKTGMRKYVESRLKREGELQGSAFAAEVLRQALCPRATVDLNTGMHIQSEKEVDIDVPKFLLEKNIDPNARFPGGDYTIWQRFLLEISDSLEWWPTWYDACELVVKYGAEREVEIEGRHLRAYYFSRGFTPGKMITKTPHLEGKKFTGRVIEEDESHSADSSLIARLIRQFWGRS